MLLFKAFSFKEPSLEATEKALETIQARLCDAGKRIYAAQLAVELENLVDEVSLNMVQKPDVPLYQAAQQLLGHRIDYEIARNQPTSHNYGVQAGVYVYGGKGYIRLFASNPEIVTGLKGSAVLEDCSVYDEEDTESKSRKNARKTWENIMDFYKGKNILYRQLYPVGQIDLEWSYLQKYFSTRDERIQKHAMYRVLSFLANVQGMGAEIPPYKLMPYITECISALDKPHIKAEMERAKLELAPILVNITEEMVKRDPNAPVNQSTFVGENDDENHDNSTSE